MSAIIHVFSQFDMPFHLGILLSSFNKQQLGDPTAYRNIPPCPVIISAIMEALQSPDMGMAAGYANACGTTEARLAIHKYHYPNGNNISSLNDKEDHSNVVVTQIQFHTKTTTTKQEHILSIRAQLTTTKLDCDYCHQ